ncbi:hypothetical protein TNCV_1198021 [Trichonephila clavipes]|uniref:Uncharacterized protein n=1 Tax=Trichonephila clavipes TaxID=2585209 RepID=A0A8X6V971_TRICX|nr:hypothetical protein TNCV_1198021 [Trichonephila clavipes]
MKIRIENWAASIESLRSTGSRYESEFERERIPEETVWSTRHRGRSDFTERTRERSVTMRRHSECARQINSPEDRYIIRLAHIAPTCIST